MITIVRTNDIVLISAIEAMLESDGLMVFVADAHVSSMEGSIGAFPRVFLAEGEYRAIARNEGKVYEREFKVVTGVDGDVEVLAR